MQRCFYILVFTLWWLIIGTTVRAQSILYNACTFNGVTVPMPLMPRYVDSPDSEIAFSTQQVDNQVVGVFFVKPLNAVLWMPASATYLSDEMRNVVFSFKDNAGNNLLSIVAGVFNSNPFSYIISEAHADGNIAYFSALEKQEYSAVSEILSKAIQIIRREKGSARCAYLTGCAYLSEL